MRIWRRSRRSVRYSWSCGEAANVLPPEKARDFRLAHAGTDRKGPDPDALIEAAVGRAHPPNVHVSSLVQSRERMFLEGLRRTVYEEYRPAFAEVRDILAEGGFRRPELAEIGPLNETNRFLNWVRLTYAPGETAWRAATTLSPEERRARLRSLGAEWAQTPDSKVPEGYVSALRTVGEAFGTRGDIDRADLDELTVGLMSLHAFYEQLRFVKGGAAALPGAFWSANGNNISKVRRSLGQLLHGSGDFAERLHDALYKPSLKLGHFGLFCALELFGTVRPEIFPPVNGRMAKALRYLGFAVHA
jgi:hypothetical protein